MTEVLHSCSTKCYQLLCFLPLNTDLTLTLLFPICTDNQLLQLQISPNRVQHGPVDPDLRNSTGLRGQWVQRHLSRGDILPTLGGTMRWSVGRLLHAGAALRWQVGLCRDGPGRGGLQGLQHEPVCLRHGGTQSRVVGSLCWEACVLPSFRALQLPAVLRRRERRERLHCLSARNLPLRQRQVGVLAVC